MAGLNDNYFLADDSMEKPVNPAVTLDVFKENQEGEEAPELREDVDLIAAATESLAISLRSLELFKERVVGEQGMSQSIALESIDVVPTLITEELPVGFYTKYPSKTLFREALEAAGDEEQSIFKKFIDFLVQMYKRVVEWLKGLLNSEASASTAVGNSAANGPTAKALFTPENTKLLTNAKSSLDKAKLTFEKVEEITEEMVMAQQEKIAKARDAYLERIADEKQKAAYEQKVAKLLEVIEKIKGNARAEGAKVGELNAILAKLPYVRKYIANQADVNKLLVTHDDTTKEVNALVTEIAELIAKENFAGFGKLMEEDRFTKTKEAIHQHSLAIIEFKQLPDEGNVDSVVTSMNVFYDQHFLNALAFGAKVTESGLEECTATTSAMEQLEKEIERLANYKFSDSEGNAKVFLEALREFNKTVITQAVQNLTVTFSITKQLVTFIKNVDNLDVMIRANIKKKTAQYILEEAKKMGFTPEQIPVQF